MRQLRNDLRMQGSEALLEAIRRRSHETGKQIVREQIVRLGQAVGRRNRRPEDSRMSQNAAVCHAEGGGLCKLGRGGWCSAMMSARSAQCGD